MSVRDGWLWLIKRTLNRATIRSARRPNSRFALVLHRGRTSGRIFETPIIVAPVPEGFVCELTYGPQVNWYRNLVAAGGGQVLHHGDVFDIDAIDRIPTSDGLTAFGPPRSVVLHLLRRDEFLLLHVVGRPSRR